MRYFKKEFLTNQLFDEHRKPIIFMPVAGNTGVAELDETKDAALIATLTKLADNRTGGVVKISAETFETLKKNEVVTKSPPRSLFLSEIRSTPDQNSIGLQAAARPAVPADTNRQGKITVIEDAPPPASIAAFRARSRPLTQPTK